MFHLSSFFKRVSVTTSSGNDTTSFSCNKSTPQGCCSFASPSGSSTLPEEVLVAAVIEKEIMCFGNGNITKGANAFTQGAKGQHTSVFRTMPTVEDIVICSNDCNKVIFDVNYEYFDNYLKKEKEFFVNSEIHVNTFGLAGHWGSSCIEEDSVYYRNYFVEDLENDIENHSCKTQMKNINKNKKEIHDHQLRCEPPWVHDQLLELSAKVVTKLDKKGENNAQLTSSDLINQNLIPTYCDDEGLIIAIKKGVPVLNKGNTADRKTFHSDCLYRNERIEYVADVCVVIAFRRNLYLKIISQNGFGGGSDFLKNPKKSNVRDTRLTITDFEGLVNSNPGNITKVCWYLPSWVPSLLHPYDFEEARDQALPSFQFSSNNKKESIPDFITTTKKDDLSSKDSRNICDNSTNNNITNNQKQTSVQSSLLPFETRKEIYNANMGINSLIVVLFEKGVAVMQLYSSHLNEENAQQINWNKGSKENKDKSNLLSAVPLVDIIPDTAEIKWYVPGSFTHVSVSHTGFHLVLYNVDITKPLTTSFSFISDCDGVESSYGSFLHNTSNSIHHSFMPPAFSVSCPLREKHFCNAAPRGNVSIFVNSAAFLNKNNFYMKNNYFSREINDTKYSFNMDYYVQGTLLCLSRRPHSTLHYSYNSPLGRSPGAEKQQGSSISAVLDASFCDASIINKQHENILIVSFLDTESNIDTKEDTEMSTYHEKIDLYIITENNELDDILSGCHRHYSSDYRNQTGFDYPLCAAPFPALEPFFFFSASTLLLPSETEIPNSNCGVISNKTLRRNNALETSCSVRYLKSIELARARERRRPKGMDDVSQNPKKRRRNFFKISSVIPWINLLGTENDELKCNDYSLMVIIIEVVNSLVTVCGEEEDTDDNTDNRTKKSLRQNHRNRATSTFCEDVWFNIYTLPFMTSSLLSDASNPNEATAFTISLRGDDDHQSMMTDSHHYHNHYDKKINNDMDISTEDKKNISMENDARILNFSETIKCSWDTTFLSPAMNSSSLWESDGDPHVEHERTSHEYPILNSFINNRNELNTHADVENDKNLQKRDEEGTKEDYFHSEKYHNTTTRNHQFGLHNILPSVFHEEMGHLFSGYICGIIPLPQPKPCLYSSLNNCFDVDGVLQKIRQQQCQQPRCHERSMKSPYPTNSSLSIADTTSEWCLQGLLRRLCSVSTSLSSHVDFQNNSQPGIHNDNSCCIRMLIFTRDISDTYNNIFGIYLCSLTIPDLFFSGTSEPCLHQGKRNCPTKKGVLHVDYIYRVTAGGTLMSSMFDKRYIDRNPSHTVYPTRGGSFFVADMTRGINIARTEFFNNSEKICHDMPWERLPLMAVLLVCSNGDGIHDNQGQIVLYHTGFGEECNKLTLLLSFRFVFTSDMGDGSIFGIKEISKDFQKKYVLCLNFVNGGDLSFFLNRSTQPEQRPHEVGAGEEESFALVTTVFDAKRKCLLEMSHIIVTPTKELFCFSGGDTQKDSNKQTTINSHTNGEYSFSFSQSVFPEIPGCYSAYPVCLSSWNNEKKNLHRGDSFMTLMRVPLSPPPHLREDKSHTSSTVLIPVVIKNKGGEDSNLFSKKNKFLSEFNCHAINISAHCMSSSRYFSLFCDQKENKLQFFVVAKWRESNEETEDSQTSEVMITGAVLTCDQNIELLENKNEKESFDMEKINVEMTGDNDLFVFESSPMFSVAPVLSVGVRIGLRIITKRTFLTFNDKKEKIVMREGSQMNNECVEEKQKVRGKGKDSTLEKDILIRSASSNEGEIFKDEDDDISLLLFYQDSMLQQLIEGGRGESTEKGVKTDKINDGIGDVADTRTKTVEIQSEISEEARISDQAVSSFLKLRYATIIKGFLAKIDDFNMTFTTTTKWELSKYFGSTSPLSGIRASSQLPPIIDSTYYFDVPSKRDLLFIQSRRKDNNEESDVFFPFSLQDSNNKRNQYNYVLNFTSGEINLVENFLLPGRYLRASVSLGASLLLADNYNGMSIIPSGFFFPPRAKILNQKKNMTTLNSDFFAATINEYNKRKPTFNNNNDTLVLHDSSKKNHHDLFFLRLFAELFLRNEWAALIYLLRAIVISTTGTTCEDDNHYPKVATCVNVCDGRNKKIKNNREQLQKQQGIAAVKRLSRVLCSEKKNACLPQSDANHLLSVLCAGSGDDFASRDEETKKKINDNKGEVCVENTNSGNNNHNENNGDDSFGEKEDVDNTAFLLNSQIVRPLKKVLHDLKYKNDSHNSTYSSFFNSTDAFVKKIEKLFSFLNIKFNLIDKGNNVIPVGLNLSLLSNSLRDMHIPESGESLSSTDAYNIYILFSFVITMLRARFERTDMGVANNNNNSNTNLNKRMTTTKMASSFHANNRGVQKIIIIFLVMRSVISYTYIEKKINEGAKNFLFDILVSKSFFFFDIETGKEAVSIQSFCDFNFKALTRQLLPRNTEYDEEKIRQFTSLPKEREKGTTTFFFAPSLMHYCTVMVDDESFFSFSGSSFSNNSGSQQHHQQGTWTTNLLGLLNDSQVTASTSHDFSSNALEKVNASYSNAHQSITTNNNTLNNISENIICTSWAEALSLGYPLIVTSLASLRAIVEAIADAQFKTGDFLGVLGSYDDGEKNKLPSAMGQPSPLLSSFHKVNISGAKITPRNVKVCALFLVLANKLTKLAVLCKLVNNEKLEKFYRRDFGFSGELFSGKGMMTGAVEFSSRKDITEEMNIINSNKSLASANAYAGLASLDFFYDFSYILSFFILSGDIESALSVLFTNSKKCISAHYLANDSKTDSATTVSAARLDNYDFSYLTYAHNPYARFMLGVLIVRLATNDDGYALYRLGCLFCSINRPLTLPFFDDKIYGDYNNNYKGILYGGDGRDGEKRTTKKCNLDERDKYTANLALIAVLEDDNLCLDLNTESRGCEKNGSFSCLFCQDAHVLSPWAWFALLWLQKEYFVALKVLICFSISNDYAKQKNNEIEKESDFFSSEFLSPGVLFLIEYCCCRNNVIWERISHSFNNARSFIQAHHTKVSLNDVNEADDLSCYIKRFIVHGILLSPIPLLDGNFLRRSLLSLERDVSLRVFSLQQSMLRVDYHIPFALGDSVVLTFLFGEDSITLQNTLSTMRGCLLLREAFILWSLLELITTTIKNSKEAKKIIQDMPENNYKSNSNDSFMKPLLSKDVPEKTFAVSSHVLKITTTKGFSGSLLDERFCEHSSSLPMKTCFNSGILAFPSSTLDSDEDNNSIEENYRSPHNNNDNDNNNNNSFDDDEMDMLKAVQESMGGGGRGFISPRVVNSFSAAASVTNKRNTGIGESEGEVQRLSGFLSHTSTDMKMTTYQVEEQIEKKIAQLKKYAQIAYAVKTNVLNILEENYGEVFPHGVSLSSIDENVYSNISSNENTEVSITQYETQCVVNAINKLLLELDVLIIFYDTSDEQMSTSTCQHLLALFEAFLIALYHYQHHHREYNNKWQRDFSVIVMAVIIYFLTKFAVIFDDTVLAAAVVKTPLCLLSRCNINILPNLKNENYQGPMSDVWRYLMALAANIEYHRQIYFCSDDIDCLIAGVTGLNDTNNKEREPQNFDETTAINDNIFKVFLRSFIQSEIDANNLFQQQQDGIQRTRAKEVQTKTDEKKSIFSLLTRWTRTAAHVQVSASSSALNLAASKRIKSAIAVLLQMHTARLLNALLLLRCFDDEKCTQDHKLGNDSTQNNNMNIAIIAAPPALPAQTYQTSLKHPITAMMFLDSIAAYLILKTSLSSFLSTSSMILSTFCYWPDTIGFFVDKHLKLDLIYGLVPYSDMHGDMWEYLQFLHYWLLVIKAVLASSSCLKMPQGHQKRKGLFFKYQNFHRSKSSQQISEQSGFETHTGTASVSTRQMRRLANFAFYSCALKAVMPCLTLPTVPVVQLAAPLSPLLPFSFMSRLFGGAFSLFSGRNSRLNEDKNNTNNNNNNDLYNHNECFCTLTLLNCIVIARVTRVIMKFVLEQCCENGSAHSLSEHQQIVATLLGQFVRSQGKYKENNSFNETFLFVTGPFTSLYEKQFLMRFNDANIIEDLTQIWTLLRVNERLKITLQTTSKTIAVADHNRLHASFLNGNGNGNSLPSCSATGKQGMLTEKCGGGAWTIYFSYMRSLLINQVLTLAASVRFQFKDINDAFLLSLSASDDTRSSHISDRRGSLSAIAASYLHLPQEEDEVVESTVRSAQPALSRSLEQHKKQKAYQQQERQQKQNQFYTHFHSPFIDGGRCGSVHAVTKSTSGGFTTYMACKRLGAAELFGFPRRLDINVRSAVLTSDGEGERGELVSSGGVWEVTCMALNKVVGDGFFESVALVVSMVGMGERKGPERGLRRGSGSLHSSLSLLHRSDVIIMSGFGGKLRLDSAGRWHRIPCVPPHSCEEYHNSIEDLHNSDDDVCSTIVSLSEVDKNFVSRGRSIILESHTRLPLFVASFSDGRYNSSHSVVQYGCMQSNNIEQEDDDECYEDAQMSRARRRASNTVRIFGGLRRGSYFANALQSGCRGNVSLPSSMRGGWERNHISSLTGTDIIDEDTGDRFNGNSLGVNGFLVPKVLTRFSDRNITTVKGSRVSPDGDVLTLYGEPGFADAVRGPSPFSDSSQFLYGSEGCCMMSRWRFGQSSIIPLHSTITHDGTGGSSFSACSGRNVDITDVVYLYEKSSVMGITGAVIAGGAYGCGESARINICSGSRAIFSLYDFILPQGILSDNGWGVSKSSKPVATIELPFVPKRLLYSPWENSSQVLALSEWGAVSLVDLRCLSTGSSSSIHRESTAVVSNANGECWWPLHAITPLLSFCDGTDISSRLQNTKAASSTGLQSGIFSPATTGASLRKIISATVSQSYPGVIAVGTSLGEVFLYGTKSLIYATEAACCDVYTDGEALSGGNYPLPSSINHERGRTSPSGGIPVVHFQDGHVAIDSIDNNNYISKNNTVLSAIGSPNSNSPWLQTLSMLISDPWLGSFSFMKKPTYVKDYHSQRVFSASLGGSLPIDRVNYCYQVRCEPLNFICLENGGLRAAGSMATKSEEGAITGLEMTENTLVIAQRNGGVEGGGVFVSDIYTSELLRLL